MLHLRTIKILILMLLPGLVRGQEVLYSKSYPFDLRGGDFSVIGKVAGKLYVYRGSNEGFFLDAYDDKMQPVATVLLDFFPKKIYETKFIATGNNSMLVLYQSIEEKNVVQFAAELDQNGRLLRGPIHIASERLGAFGNRYFASAVSKDKKRVMIYGVKLKGGDMSIEYYLLNEKLELLNKGKAAFRADNNLEHGDGIVSNEGRLYLPVYTPVGSKSYADQLWLLEIPGGTGSDLRVAEFQLNEQFTGGTYMEQDTTTGRIYIGGFYSDKKSGNLQGVLYAYYDINEAGYKNRRMIPFDEGMRLASGNGNKKRAFNDYRVRNIIVKNDGGFLLIAEDYFVSTRNSYASPFSYYYSYYYPGMSSSVREFHYNDLMAMSYDGEGKQEWKTFIRKNQYSLEDGGIFSSFGLLNTGGALGFLYNDFNSLRSSVQLASLEGTGDVKMQPLRKMQDDDADWLPRSGKQTGAREFVVPCMRRRQICFAKIVF
jgi:hypothetical protein